MGGFFSIETTRSLLLGCGAVSLFYAFGKTVAVTRFFCVIFFFFQLFPKVMVVREQVIKLLNIH